MATEHPTFSQCLVLATALKLLLIPAYRSTDFEVHRNWLAITHSLPSSKWYLEDTSEWTLDYPPFFAIFEWLLSQLARFFDPGMLQVNNLNYASPQTVYFQRLSVIVSELVLVLSLRRFVAIQDGPQAKKVARIIALSLLLSPAFLIIDHIHFQYNGMMFGILIFSLSDALTDNLLRSGILFAVLLCFKHIYLYIAPAYFAYLLRRYCLGENLLDIQIVNCLKLGSAIGAIFAAAFGYFTAIGQIPQLLSRLFPFSRGLCHAYWAPNAWALYAFTDRVLILLAPRLNLSIDSASLGSATRGLVGDTSFAVLPNIPPRVTFLLTLAVQLVCLAKVFMQPSPTRFVGAVTLCGFASFMFGWHVHEKAILLPLVPFSLLALQDRRYLGAFRPLAVAGHISLFPLVFKAAEFPIKSAYTILWILVFFMTFDTVVPVAKSQRIFFLDRFEIVYMTVGVPLILYTELFHFAIFGSKLEFLPLMFTSSYCALGILGSFLGFFTLYLTS
ncbi:dolichyl pyrophosphate Glc1Man9GlcNAc2 alpha-1,3-glucosyltransferase [Drechslerella stenobrocha 248]|uniref:Alpha-1,3-glucosyltransferase n=1 Tax=Drechslerella stenobrocha 248 TaxID=1043628 RepID=W7I3P3_9PEZI|nr:dolichyl pyrophosphate Glc1Man9GlcNAc2 alpha-1,3-glucosyltransferase [Drechslerella stenobrocha 248]